MTPADRLIVALDVASRADSDAALERVGAAVRWVKVGSVLFAAEGPRLVTELASRGYRVFLDLKLHDIPHQVALTVAQLADLGASLLTVHTAGGGPMLEAAVRAAAGSGAGVLGVTVLTSLDGPLLAATGVPGSPAEVVAQRAKLAIAAGLAGVVSSPHEAAAVAAVAPAGFEIVTPGIRPGAAAVGDQRRVATPRAAIAAGATRIVVGRAILGAADPAAAVAAILAELEAAA